MGFWKLTDLRKLIGWMRLGLRTVRGSGVGMSFTLLSLIAIRGLVPVVRLFAMANLVAVVPEVVSGQESASDRLLFWAWVFIAVLTVTGLAGPLTRATTERLMRQVDGRLRERVMVASLAPPGTTHLIDPEIRQVVDAAKAAAPVTGLTPGRVAGLLPNVIGSRVLTIGMVAGIAWVDWRLGIAFLLLNLVSQDQMQKALWRLSAGGGASAPGIVDYQLELASTAPAGKELRLFGLGDWMLDRYRTGMDTHMRGVWAGRNDFTPGMIATLAATAVVNIVALIVLGFAAARGEVSIAEVTFCIAAIMALTPTGALNADDIPMAFASDVTEKILAAEAALLRLGASRTDAGPVPDEWTTVRFEDVSFAYPGAERNVLSGLSIELRRGERTALVGVNGAGKTTLVKLLCGVYRPTAGRILVDDVDLESIDHHAWRNTVSALFQDFLHYEVSARDNLRYGAVSWNPEDLDDQLTRVADEVGIAPVLDRLPQGWDSTLDPGYADGAALSGGEWQRVGLARSLVAVRAGAEVLILDEPTASLDVLGEAELFEVLMDVTAPGRGTDVLTIFVSHRFSTVRRADRILVLEDGLVREDGDHATLLAAGGTYAEMFTAQASQYARSDVATPEDGR